VPPAAALPSFHRDFLASSKIVKQKITEQGPKEEAKYFLWRDSD